MPGPGYSANERGEREEKRARMQAFAAAYIECGGSITAACKKLGIHRSTYRRWMNEEPGFVLMMDDANKDVADNAHEEVYRRAVRGIDDGSGVIKYSDRLLERYAEAVDPVRYGKRVVESEKKKDAPIFKPEEVLGNPKALELVIELHKTMKGEDDATSSEAPCDSSEGNADDGGDER